MSPFDETALIRRIQTLTGIDDPSAVQRIGRAVISVLQDELPAHDRAWLAQRLPAPWAEAAHPSAIELRDGLTEFYDRVAAREGIDPGFAREHAQSCCRALAEALDEDARRRLASRLPDELAGLLDVTSAGAGVAPGAERGAPRAHRRRSTLSEGRPGSRAPVSEAAPRRAHQDSIARSANPHADTKLSSSPGTTQEREHDTLARGRPKP